MASKLSFTCYIEIITWNGYRYELINEEISWNDAEQYCVERGGHLASSTSNAENQFLKQFTTAQYNNGYVSNKIYSRMSSIEHTSQTGQEYTKICDT